MSNRGELLLEFSKKGYSGKTRLEASAIIKDLTDVQKEEKAGQILAMIKNAKNEKEFILMLNEIK